MRDNLTGRSRGFAFLNFVDPKAVNTVMVREHYLDGKVIDPKRAIPRPQHSHHQGGGGAQSNNYNSGGGGGSHSGQSQKLFVGGLPPSVTPASFRNFFEQYGTLSECTCMTDRETGKPRGFGFLTYADDASLERVLSTRPIVFDGKEVDVKRAQSKNDPQSLQMRRQQRTDQPGIGMQQGGGRYGMGTGSNNFNVGGNTGWGGMNPMMGMGMGAQGFDPSAMAQMYQNMGWGGAQGWNPQMNMAWQQMMASMGGAAAGGAGMDMSAMMNMAGMSNMGNMGMMGAGMGSMSPPMRAGSSMSPTMGSAATAMPKGPSADGGSDRGGSRYQRGGSHTAGGGRPGPGSGSRDERERSPRSGSASNCGRERSPNRAGGNGRYDNGNRDNRY
nr:related to HRP1-subunit of cleavage factor I [Melanopsichium pennsylvanicum 4]